MALGYPNSVLVGYSSRGKSDAFSVPADKQVWIYNARAFNNQGGAQAVGICRKHIQSQIELFRYTAIGTVYTQIALSSVLGGAAIFSGTINDGFVIQDKRRFNLIGLHITTGQSTGVYVYQYWNGAAWTSLTTISTADFTSSSSDQWISFRAPSDWVAGGPSGLEPDAYAIRVTSSTAPAGAISINDLWIAEFLEYYDAVPNNAAVQISFPDTKPFLLNGGESLFPFYATASTSNQFGCFYSIHL